MFLLGEYHMFQLWSRYDAFDIFWSKMFGFFELILAYSFYATTHLFLAFHGPTFRAWITKLASRLSLIGFCGCYGMCPLMTMHFVRP